MQAELICRSHDLDSTVARQTRCVGGFGCTPHATKAANDSHSYSCVIAEDKGGGHNLISYNSQQQHS